MRRIFPAILSAAFLFSACQGPVPVRVVKEIRQIQYTADDLWLVERFQDPSLSPHPQAARYSKAAPEIQKEILATAPTVERLVCASLLSQSSALDTIFDYAIAGEYKVVSGRVKNDFRVEELREGRYLNLPVRNDSLKLVRLPPQLVYVEYYQYPVIIDRIMKNDTLCLIPYTVNGVQQGKLFKPGLGVYVHGDNILVLSRSEFKGWRLFELRGRCWGPVFDAVDGDFQSEGKTWINVTLEGKRCLFNVTDSVFLPVSYAIRKVFSTVPEIDALVGGPRPPWSPARGKSLDRLQAVSSPQYGEEPADSLVPDFWFNKALVQVGPAFIQKDAANPVSAFQYLRDASTVQYLQVRARTDSLTFRVKTFLEISLSGKRPSIALQNQKMAYTIDDGAGPAIYEKNFIKGTTAKIYPVGKKEINLFAAPKDE
jgi:hypothetical protein